jgi:formylglycine-generating enzyme required for sulfatase activity
VAFSLSLTFGLGVCWAADPVVSNMRARQLDGTQRVEITYDLADADSATVNVAVAVSDNGGASYAVPATNFSGAVGSGVTPGANRKFTWDAGKDWPGKYSVNMRFKVTAQDAPPAPAGMVLIPAGTFAMGDSFGEGDSDERPVHTVTVSAFFMDQCEVTKALWDEVYGWAIAHGYGFDIGGSGKAMNHPVHTVIWYDAVKWCNARSEKEGRVWAYYTSAAQTVPYRGGMVNVQNEWVRWNAGYRLPTEAEWEYAARGGLSGKRFPWGDTISHPFANYYSNSSDTYDTSPTRGFHPTFVTEGYPYSSPGGYFAPNSYGLYDMAGNMWEWCWDWYGPYGGSAQRDPRGPTSGWVRVFRGGSWWGYARDCRVSSRIDGWPSNAYNEDGFRSVLPPGH